MRLFTCKWTCERADGVVFLLKLYYFAITRFIKEGDTASVIGIVKQHHSYNIIDPPGGAITTGCQWKRCIFPLLVEGLVIIGDESSDDLVYVV
jgi:hypothetical protein